MQQLKVITQNTYKLLHHISKSYIHWNTGSSPWGPGWVPGAIFMPSYAFCLFFYECVFFHVSF